MATAADEDAMRLYLALMEEAKARAFSMNALSNDQRGVPSPFVREYCYLQLRMLCELIALGCLVAHGDIEYTRSKKLQKAYEPDVILKQLSALHSEFYPVPRAPVQTETGWHLGDYEGDYLTKEDLLKLYGLCGDVLHRGNLKRLTSQRSPIQKNFADVTFWGQKILNLLSNHTITRIGGAFHFLTMLETTDLNGAVQVAIAELP